MQSLLDQVNILIKMKVGDPYRLEHIKLMLKQKRTVYGSDRAYLDHLIHDYIEQVKTQKKLSKMIWYTGGCRSWYISGVKKKNVTIWPGTTISYRFRTKKVNLSDYHIVNIKR